MSGFRTKGAVSATVAIPASAGRPTDRHPVVFLRDLIARKLGRCVTCVRLSLVFSILGWFVFAILNASLPASPVAEIAFAGALGFTGLFAAHLVAFIGRVVRGVRRAQTTDRGLDRSQASPVPEGAMDRRGFLVTSLKIAGLGLAAVMLPSALLSAEASAGPNKHKCPPMGDCTTCVCCGCSANIPSSCPNYYTCNDLCHLNCGQ